MMVQYDQHLVNIRTADLLFQVLMYTRWTCCTAEAVPRPPTQGLLLLLPYMLMTWEVYSAFQPHHQGQII